MAWTRPVAALLVILPCLAGCGDGASKGSAHVEDIFTAPASQVLLRREGKRAGALTSQMLLVLEDIRSGKPFDEIARNRSEDEASAARGGFLGFPGPQTDEKLAPVLQALVTGHVAGPVDLEDGVHFLLRHSFEEGRRLEKESTIPAYGFFVNWGRADAPSKTAAEARARAAAARERILAGEDLSLVALETVGRHPQRHDYFIGNITEKESQASLYAALDKLAPGEVSELLELKEVAQAVGVVRRGAYFRCYARQILITHAETGLAELHTTTRSALQARELAEKILAEAARDGSNWAQLVTAHSESPSVIPTQGTLGCVTNGNLPPELEELLLATPPGRVADRLAETQRGFHILYRVN